jgi:hypothetical protein
MPVDSDDLTVEQFLEAELDLMKQRIKVGCLRTPAVTLPSAGSGH